MRELELLAPARNADIGIAAIDCGADAVYIAGPEFGARQAAGNSMQDVRRVCNHAHRYGARVFLTLNTILFDDELDRAAALLDEAKEAGVDAVIAQDPAVWTLTSLPVHASTQCAIRTPGKARMYENLGASRLVLEREMSLEQIKAVRAETDCELEFFVHGALCVCYSGQCYMSESICGRSANRGECIQACRSLYDLQDEDGRTLVRNKALLSLKDYNLAGRLEDLAEAGISSFKIEGRLKNMTYVRNVVRAYSEALDKIVKKSRGEYRRASFGHPEGGFVPDLGKTFNRGYTELFLDGRRGSWSSMDAPKSMGEETGMVISFEISQQRTGDRKEGQMAIALKMKDPSARLSNGAGFSFVAKSGGEIIGFRGDVCQGNRIFCKSVPGLYKGARIFRNLDNAFEKEVGNNVPRRLLGVDVKLEIGSRDGGYTLGFSAKSEDGRTAELVFPAGTERASNPERMENLFKSQLSKTAGIFSFDLTDIHVSTMDGSLPILSSATINGIRRELADMIDRQPCRGIPLPGTSIGKKGTLTSKDGSLPYDEINDGCKAGQGEVSYKANVANRISRNIYTESGAMTVNDAFEARHTDNAELMRTKYCIRHELGMCPLHQSAGKPGRLFLYNNGSRYALGFDCRNCEMTVSKAK